MNTKTRKYIVYVAFVLALIYGFYNLKDSFDKKNTVLAPAPVVQTVPQVIIPAKSIDIEKYETLNWGRDPFYRAKKGGRPVIVEKAKPDWILNGILFNKNAPSAVINKKIVGIGDKINGAKIIEITKSKVVLKKENDDTFILKI